MTPLHNIRLYAEGSLFQVLEGDEKAVAATFARIQSDKRHQQTTCIIREPIAKRAFAGWTMGYASLASDQAAAIVGLNDFFDARHCLANLDAGRARKLLQAFRDGRWRTCLNRPQLAAAQS